MANHLGEVIERYLKANHTDGSTKCLKFTYTETYSSTDNSRKIDVNYKIGQVKEVSYYSGQSKFTAVVKEKVSDGNESLELFMYLRVMPEMKRILEEYNKCPADDVIPKVPLLLANDEIERRLYAAIKIIEGYWPEFKDITTKLRSYVETINKSITGLMANKLSQYKIIALGEPSIKNMLVETIQQYNNVRILDANVVFVSIFSEYEHMYMYIYTYLFRYIRIYTRYVVVKISAARPTLIYTLPHLIYICFIYYFLQNNFKNCFVGYCGYDLNFFFFANLTLDMLTSHRYELLHYYHEHFAATLKSLNESSIPSWVTILQEVREFEFIGIYALLCEMPIYNSEYNFQNCCTLESENSNFAPISFEQQYEILFNSDRVKTLLKYGLDRFYELHMWDKTN
ncbi:PREDICTED: uncharacterized protein LOC108360435 [Rhagoletis zephyria]|uniref:uncharacterized protein LOC108360435 n=1 Tax=Rhagoletis zephyria TaxID=28612 RepID=UPI000811996B|nr:PREDICTED: uncharacterized protein LOC108360435 [Rhagoletis zephyria]